jgi:hypothetical protein
MADNVTVSNSPSSSNTDIPVRTTETSGSKHIQHMMLHAQDVAATVSRVSASASSTLLLAANSERLDAHIYNDSTATLYVKFGTAATSTSFTAKLDPGSWISWDSYDGIVHGVWSSATGAAQCTENAAA